MPTYNYSLTIKTKEGEKIYQQTGHGYGGRTQANAINNIRKGLNGSLSDYVKKLKRDDELKEICKKLEEIIESENNKI